jgi:two-component system chemotaxis response regulator CheY
MTTDLSWAGLTGPTDRAHLHDAPLGVSRFDPPYNEFFHEVQNDTLVTVPCWLAQQGACAAPMGSLHDVFVVPPVGTITCAFYADCDMAKIINIATSNGLYIDVHTELYPSGEIRGQLYATAVPEPSSLWLLMSGVLVLAAVALKKRPKSSHALYSWCTGSSGSFNQRRLPMGLGRILVVDDEPDVRKTVSMTLTKAGFDIIEAEDGEKAIKEIRSGDNPLMVDAILCDLYMPKVNGMEASAFFRKQFPQVPVIIMTGQPDVINATELMKRGIVDYLIKPISPEKLREVISKHVKGHVYKDPFKT